MKFTVEVTHVEIAEMGVSAEQLEVAVKQKLEGGLNVDGDTLYMGSPRFQCNNWRYANPALARGWCW